ncbi:hypothetical protein COU54_02480 [Candidatus Pacearchaeota archaeon CG10_big_fil_rev_8_21_14_0_10_31_24]|nr:MAG: hypothetical protein COU54_02480 [Candidatus Pacearchaeota archaeon CG10_big_fil_rev_8_21_14_0_10_31_24]
MQSNEDKVQYILKKYKDAFDEMQHYDETREKLWKKKRVDITLTHRLIKKLKEHSKKTGKPVSHIIEEAIESKI